MYEQSLFDLVQWNLTTTSSRDLKSFPQDQKIKFSLGIIWNLLHVVVLLFLLYQRRNVIEFFIVFVLFGNTGIKKKTFISFSSL